MGVVAARRTMSAMYKHILVPTDGSRLSGKGAREGVRLAKALGAKVTGVYVAAPYYQPPAYLEGGVYIPGVSPQAYRKLSERQAKKALAPVEAAAKKARVRCTTRMLTARKPSEGILKAARTMGCDAIAMASHHRGGVSALLLGSETRRVLLRAKIPVVVFR
jgi:nucleotide-binding universal stress UspA family protein